MTRKADNLAVIAGHDVAVPRGFLLRTAHFDKAVAPIRAELIRALRAGESVADALVDRITIPDDTRQAIATGLTGLSEFDRFAVRSSGSVVAGGEHIAEDGAETSLAGQFESYLAVPGHKVPDAVALCWASLFNARSIACFGADKGYVENSAMSVLIQAMIPAAASAVMMTMDPLGEGDTGGVELTIGPCGAIVAGVITPDEVIFDRTTGEIVSISIGRKHAQIHYHEFGTGEHDENATLVPVDPEARDRLSVESPAIHELIALGLRIEAIFGRPQDIEAVITPNGDIVVTQTRPVTCLPAAGPEPIS